MARHYDAAAVGRRTSGWNRTASDANAAAQGAARGFLRAQARDLVRNNPWARKGIRRIVNNTVGWGIRPKATGGGAERISEVWKLWAETTQCDAAGRLNLYGLQRLAMRCIVESGEVIIRRRWRRPSDGLAVPMQLQILEPDFLDTLKDGMQGEEGGPIIQGVEFDALGNRVAYWLFDRHPGSAGIAVMSGSGGGRFNLLSRRIPAEGIVHVFDMERAGQVRGASWFASVDLRLHDFDEYEGATLDKQKIAACMAAFVTDTDGLGTALGQPSTDPASGQNIDTFEPGMIIPLQPGKQVTIANPPSSTDHQSFTAASLRGVAAGLGVTYEELCGDYSQVNYSSARMSRLAHQSDVEDWRWNMLIPQLCEPVWSWMLEAMIIAGEEIEPAPAEWSPSPMPILDPDKEIQGYQRAIRNGLMTWGQVVRELGYDPREQLAEVVAQNAEFDADDVVFDCDPRRTNAQGQQQTTGGAQQASSAIDGGVDATDPADAANGTTH